MRSIRAYLCVNTVYLVAEMTTKHQYQYCSLYKPRKIQSVIEHVAIEVINLIEMDFDFDFDFHVTCQGVVIKHVKEGKVMAQFSVVYVTCIEKGV